VVQRVAVCCRVLQCVVVCCSVVQCVGDVAHLETYLKNLLCKYLKQ